MEHPIISLFARLEESFQRYPAGMVPVPWRDGVIEGTSFFPGGYGFVKVADENLPQWREGEIMVIGNDWGNETSFFAARKAKSEATGSTWLGIKALSNALDLRDCFFTNAFMGLREGSISAVGECPGRKDPHFKEACREFLAEQIMRRQPRLIFTLGRFAPDMLSALAPALSGWSISKPTWKRIDALGPLHEGVVFNVIPERGVTVCALTHPDRGHLNYKHRTYGVYGDELGLVRAALKVSSM